MTNKLQRPRILIGTTGSVDITLLPHYLKELKKCIDCTVTLLMSPSAANFFAAETLALFVDKVVCDESPANWPENKPSKIIADHDILAIIPTTANTLAMIAQGAAPNRLTTVVIAASFPVIIFPGMGTVMWEKAAVQRNVKQIKEDGYYVVHPVVHETFDASLNKVVNHPSIPEPKEVIALLRSNLSKQFDDSVLNRLAG